MRFDAGHLQIPPRDGCKCTESEVPVASVGYTFPLLQLAGEASPVTQELLRRCARYARRDAEVSDPASFLVVQLGVDAMSPATPTDILTAASDAPTDAGLLDDSDELLVEEISIDGMCGVY